MKTIRMLIRARHLTDGTLCTKPTGHAVYRIRREQQMVTVDGRMVWFTNQMFMVREKDVCVIDPGFEVAVTVTITEAYAILKRINDEEQTDG